MLTLHRFHPRVDSCFRLQDTANVLAQSIQEADQLAVLDFGSRLNALGDIHDKFLHYQEGLPGIIPVQCIVLLKAPDEVHERLIALSDAACELLEAVSVEGQFQIRDQRPGSGNCFITMR